MPAKLDPLEAIRRMQEVRPEYGFNKFVYTGSGSKGVVECHLHGEFLAAHSSIMGGHGCPACKRDNVAARRRKPPETALIDMQAVAPQYDFSRFDYCGSKAKGIVVCCLHGEFLSDYGSIVGGKGCPKCGLASRGLKSRLDSAEAISRMQSAMPSLDFSLFEYKSSASKSVVVCQTHGKFLKSYNHILAGVGCKKCSSEAKSKQATISFSTFIGRANKTHRNTYTYKEETYTGTSGKIIAVCRTHGEFEVSCFDHTCGQGCPSCKDSNFNPNKRAFLYVYKLVKDGIPYVGYGITSSIRRRHEEHLKRCQKAGVTASLLHTFRFRMGLFCRRAETQILKEFRSINLGVRGFKKETAEWVEYPKLLAMAENLHKMHGKSSSVL